MNTETEKNETVAETAGEATPSVAPAADPSGGDSSNDVQKLKQQLLRTAADYDNYRKRSRREVEDAALRGKELTIRDFLPIFDNLDRALSAASTSDDGRGIVEGVRMVLKQFEDTCERIGIRRIATVGERFDPTAHEAIQQLETNDHAPGTIVAEVAAGYMFGPRLLRAAMVVVAKPQAKVIEPAAEPEASNT